MATETEETGILMCLGICLPFPQYYVLLSYVIILSIYLFMIISYLFFRNMCLVSNSRECILLLQLHQSGAICPLSNSPHLHDILSNNPTTLKPFKGMFSQEVSQGIATALFFVLFFYNYFAVQNCPFVFLVL